MKFLVMFRPNGQPHQFNTGHMRGQAAGLQELLTSGAVEVAYVFVAGGGAYVVNASDTKELFEKVRGNPLFKSSTVEVHPIADATDFLEGYADYVGK
jgi:hypothetical protein